MKYYKIIIISVLLILIYGCTNKKEILEDSNYKVTLASTGFSSATTVNSLIIELEDKEKSKKKRILESDMFLDIELTKLYKSLFIFNGGYDNDVNVPDFYFVYDLSREMNLLTLSRYSSFRTNLIIDEVISSDSNLHVKVIHTSIEDLIQIRLSNEISFENEIFVYTKNTISISIESNNKIIVKLSPKDSTQSIIFYIDVVNFDTGELNLYS